MHIFTADFYGIKVSMHILEELIMQTKRNFAIRSADKTRNLVYHSVSIIMIYSCRSESREKSLYI